MERNWYLSRDGQVFGPVADAQLAQSVAAGRVLPGDLLNVAGEPDWVVAAAVPGLLPRPKARPVARTARVTCFACFGEVTIEYAPGAPNAPCPKCRALIETNEGATAEPAANQAAFAKLESPAEFKKRMQQKVADAEAAAGRDAAILGGVLGGIIGQ